MSIVVQFPWIRSSRVEILRIAQQMTFFRIFSELFWIILDYFGLFSIYTLYGILTATHFHFFRDAPGMMLISHYRVYLKK